MSKNKDKRKKELEKEIKKLQKRLEVLDEDEFVDEDEVEFARPLPPLAPVRPHKAVKIVKPVRAPRAPRAPQPPSPPRRARAGSRSYSTTNISEEDRARLQKEREKLRKELSKMRDEFGESRQQFEAQKREYEAYRRTLRDKERTIRDKERQLRDKKFSSYTFDVDLDEDIEGMTKDLESNLGEYTRSILASVAESLKSSMGIAVRSAGDIGQEIKISGKEIGKIGKEIGDKISKDLNVKIGPKIPAEKLEEFFEIGASIVSSIGDSNRLRILKELEKGPLFQKELSDITTLRGGTFKHHMDKLMDDAVKFVTQEVVRGRYHLTTRGREALKLAEIQYIRYLEEMSREARVTIIRNDSDDDEEFNVKIK